MTHSIHASGTNSHIYLSFHQVIICPHERYHRDLIITLSLGPPLNHHWRSHAFETLPILITYYPKCSFLELKVDNAFFSYILCGHVMSTMRLKYFLKWSFRFRALFTSHVFLCYFFVILIPCGTLGLVLTFVTESHTLVRTAQNNKTSKGDNIACF